VNRRLPSAYRLSQEVARALELRLPLVALESTVITHGLPYPENQAAATGMMEEIRKKDVIPAIVGVLDGTILIGLVGDQLERLAKGVEMNKVSTRDFAVMIARKWSGGTTVAGTMVAAYTAGISVFSTGGIGGVHRDNPHDVSVDLHQLAQTPMIVVCAGAKAILDLPATLERLETFSIPVVGYQTEEFPAFYSTNSGLRTSCRADTPQEVIEIAKAHWSLGRSSAILVVVPPPEEVAIPNKVVMDAIESALKDADEKRIRGKEVTPFLLQRVNEITEGKSLRANLGLLHRNAQVGAEIAQELMKGARRYQV